LSNYQLHSNFGTRYYDPDLSMWLSVYTEIAWVFSVLACRSVDPMADARSWVSPYSYVQNSLVIWAFSLSIFP
jgi:hypothetical protein